MELNHEYQNRYIRGIISVINSAVECGGVSKNVFEQLVYQEADDPNRRVGVWFVRGFQESDFFKKSPKTHRIPKLPVKISLMPTEAELQWLLHALQSPLAALFLDESVRELLLDRLKKAGITDQMRHIRHYGFAEPELPDTVMFRTVLSAIREHRYLTVTNHARSGAVYRNENIIPMKMEYNAVSGRWFLSFCPADRSRPIKAYLGALSDVSVGEVVPEEQRPDLREMMKAKKAEPLLLRVFNQMNAPARAIAFFSQYDTAVVKEPDGGLRMEIRYYSFDEDTLLRKIIGFGPCLQVLSPMPIVDKMKAYLTNLPY